MPEDPRSTRSQRLVLTLFGDYLRQRSDAVWVGSLIQLLEPLGLTDQAVRSTLSRMLRRGWFTTSRHGRLSYYSLTDRTKRLLDEGEERLYSPRQPRPWTGKWHLLSYSVPEAQRELRDRLRQRLVWLGYGRLSPSTWLSPYEPPPELQTWLEATGAGQFADMFVAEHVGSDTKELVARAWDLEGLGRAYHEFISLHRPQYEATSSPASPGVEPIRAFARSFDLTQDYLDFPYVDPGLPAVLLPDDWPGSEVRQLFNDYHVLLRVPSEAFVESVLEEAAQRSVEVAA